MRILLVDDEPALRELLRRGLGDRAGRRGLDDLLRRVRERQREIRGSGRLDGILEQARALLDTAVGQERAELFPDPGDEARMREADLDALPADHTPGRRDWDRLSRRWRGTFGVLFSPAASDKALKAIRQTVRSWALHERSDKSLDDLARMFNSHIRGWINYYGRYYKSALHPTLRHIDRILARWAHRKFKSLRRHRRQTTHWIARVARRQPSLFAHWGLLQGRGRTMGAG